MSRRTASWKWAIGGAAAVAIGAGAWLSLGDSRRAVEAQWATLDRYCVDCHNGIDVTAGIAFDELDPSAVHADPELFERVVRKLRGRMMPPPGGPLPSEAEYLELVGFLESELDARGARDPDPGAVALHRLNRTEYAYAIQDLFGLEVDPASLLPKDDESDGFDNVANVLGVSPSFLDQYINAARVISAMAMGEREAKLGTSVYLAEPGVSQSRHVDGLPLGTRGGMLVEHHFPVDGEYTFTLRGLVSAGYTIGMEYRHELVMTLDGEAVFEHTLGGESDLRIVDQQQAAGVAKLREPLTDIRLPVTAGPHEIGIAFAARSFAESDELLEPFTPGGGEQRIMSVRRLEIEGPHEISGLSSTPSRERIFVCEPSAAGEERACAEQILTNVMRRAYRRPVTDDDLAGPMAFFARGRERGGFEAGIENGLVAVLSSPKFLYRAEPPPAGLEPGSSYRIGDFELTSRLAFFLWSRLPDEPLLELAERGRLSEPDVLEAQVERMLADPRSKALVTNFAFQWLELRELDDIDPDGALFPAFDRDVRNAFATEMELWLDSVLREDGSVLELLTSSHTFVNERLALHYGLTDVRGDRFRRVELDDPNRHGLFGKGGILMITSYPNRTAPVLRGAWILEVVTGTPPASPPPDVEALPETQEGQVATTVRERLEIHRDNPACNGCHGVMDPLGFALENFDAVGRWRDVDGHARTAIDSSGELADGTAVDGPVDLRNALLERPDLLVQTLTEKLMTYALGRGVEHYDMPTVRHIVRRAAENDYRFSSLLKGIVASDAFQMKKVPEEDERVIREAALDQ